MQSIENKVLSRIRGHGRGWVFSAKDFIPLGSAETIHVTLHRMKKQGDIRRVLRGVYDFPVYSDLLEQNLSPDTTKVADALARKNNWRICPDGSVALNMMGLSTQVPGRFHYFSDGPSRSYDVFGTKLTFKHTALKDVGFEHWESALLVQAIKSLGTDYLTPDVINHLRQWLPPAKRRKVLHDTQYVTTWIHQAIRQIYQEQACG